MFNLPNNTPYVVIIESDNGYMVMSNRWESIEGPEGQPGEMGPTGTFETYTRSIDVLAAVEQFMAESPFDETD